MQYTVIFIGIQIQLQIMLCYSYIYYIIPITFFKTQTNKIQLQSQHSPMKNVGSAPCPTDK
jgi:hypothetical protein